MLSGAANRNFSNSAQQIALMIHTKNLKNRQLNTLQRMIYLPIAYTIEKLDFFKRTFNYSEGQEISERHCGVLNSPQKKKFT